MPEIQVGCVAKRLKKARQKTVSIFEVKSFADAEAQAKEGLKHIGMVNEWPEQGAKK